jgi:MFS family permease
MSLGKPSNYRSWYIVILLSALSLTSYFDRLALNLLIEPVRQDLHLSDTQIGLLIGPAFAFLYAFAAFPAAFVVDRGNRKLLLVAGVLLWAMMTAASAFAPSFGWLLFCRAGVGIGEAVVTPVAISMIGDLFPRERRPAPAGVFLAMSVFGAAFSFIAVAGVLDLVGSRPPQAALLAGMVQWRLVLLAASLPGLLLAPLFLLTTSEPPREPPTARPDDSVDAAARSRTTVRLFVPAMIASALIGMTSFATMTWYPTYLMRRFAMSPEEAGYLFGTFTLIGGVLGTFAIPYLSQLLDRRGRRKASLLPIVLISMPASLALFLIALFTPGILVSLIAIGVFKGLNNGASSATDVVIANVGASDARGRLVAVRTLLGQIVGASGGPVLVPLISDHVLGGRLGPAMAVLGLVALPAAFLFYLLAWPWYRQAIARASS